MDTKRQLKSPEGIIPLACCVIIIRLQGEITQSAFSHHKSENSISCYSDLFCFANILNEFSKHFTPDATQNSFCPKSIFHSLLNLCKFRGKHKSYVSDVFTPHKISSV